MRNIASFYVSDKVDELDPAQLSVGILGGEGTDNDEDDGNDNGHVGHEGGDLLVRESLRHINEMWETE